MTIKRTLLLAFLLLFTTIQAADVQIYHTYKQCQNNNGTISGDLFWIYGAFIPTGNCKPNVMCPMVTSCLNESDFSMNKAIPDDGQTWYVEVNYNNSASGDCSDQKAIKYYQMWPSGKIMIDQQAPIQGVLVTLSTKTLICNDTKVLTWYTKCNTTGQYDGCNVTTYDLPTCAAVQVGAPNYSRTSYCSKYQTNPVVTDDGKGGDNGKVKNDDVNVKEETSNSVIAAAVATPISILAASGLIFFILYKRRSKKNTVTPASPNGQTLEATSPV